MQTNGGQNDSLIMSRECVNLVKFGIFQICEFPSFENLQKIWQILEKTLGSFVEASWGWGSGLRTGRA